MKAPQGAFFYRLSEEIGSTCGAGVAGVNTAEFLDVLTLELGVAAKE